MVYRPRFWLILIAALSLSVPGFQSFADTRGQVAVQFLSSVALEKSLRAQIVSRIEATATRSEWLIDASDVVYGVAAIRCASDSNRGVQAQLDKAAVKGAFRKAEHLLFLYAAGERIAVGKYRNSEALANALIVLDGKSKVAARLSPDLQSMARTIDGFGVALVFVPRERIQVYQSSIWPYDLLRDAYCAETYLTAHALFQSGNYEKALPVLKEVHDLKWAMPEAYLDAAECFQKVGEASQSSKLLKEILEQLGPRLSSGQSERLGDLMLSCRLVGEAQTAFELALIKYHQENTTPSR